jgi:hypothetical protein
MASRNQSDKRKLELLSQLTVHRMDITTKKQVLLQQMAESKEQLRDKMNIPKRIIAKVKSSFSNNTTKWFIGSALGGLILSKIFIGSGNSSLKVKKSNLKPATRGMFATLTSLAMRPILKNLIIGTAKSYVMQRFMSHHAQISQHDQEYEADHYAGQ